MIEYSNKWRVTYDYSWKNHKNSILPKLMYNSINSNQNLNRFLEHSNAIEKLTEKSTEAKIMKTNESKKYYTVRNVPL